MCGMHKAANKSSFAVNEIVAFYEGNSPGSVLNLGVTTRAEGTGFLHVCDHRELVGFGTRRGLGEREKCD